MYMKWNNWLLRNYIHHVESYDYTNRCWAKFECETTVERFGTAKSVQTCFITQCEISLSGMLVADIRRSQSSGMICIKGHSNLSVQGWVLCKNWNRKYKNGTVIPMIRVLCYNFTDMWTPFVTQTIYCAAVLVTTYWSNTDLFWILH